MDPEIEQNFNKVQAWLDKRGYSLFRSRKKTIVDEVDTEIKVVFISERSKPINQLYSLLHECGHIVERSKKNYIVKYKEKTQREDNPSNNYYSYRYLVEEIEEEISAWRHGEELARKLGICIDEKEYYKYGSRWVMTYIVQAAVGKEHLLGSVSNKKSKTEPAKQQEEQEKGAIF